MTLICSQASSMLEKTCSIFQITISRLPVKAKKIYKSRCLYKLCLIRIKSLAFPKLSFPALHLSCSPYILPKSTQFLHLSSLAY